jgi:hypothetical protein
MRRKQRLTCFDLLLPMVLGANEMRDASDGFRYPPSAVGFDPFLELFGLVPEVAGRGYGEVL